MKKFLPLLLVLLVSPARADIELTGEINGCKGSDVIPFKKKTVFVNAPVNGKRLLVGLEVLEERATEVVIEFGAILVEPCNDGKQRTEVPAQIHTLQWGVEKEIVFPFQSPVKVKFSATPSYMTSLLAAAAASRAETRAALTAVS